MPEYTHRLWLYMWNFHLEYHIGILRQYVHVFGSGLHMASVFLNCHNVLTLELWLLVVANREKRAGSKATPL
jgi:hypothetical protein